MQQINSEFSLLSAAELPGAASEVAALKIAGRIIPASRFGTQSILLRQTAYAAYNYDNFNVALWTTAAWRKSAAHSADFRVARRHINGASKTSTRYGQGG